MARSRKRQTSSRTATTGSTTIRIEEPKNRRQQKTTIEINPVGGFVDFLRGYAIIGLAIGFVIGTQVQTLVKQLVSSFIDPLFKLLLGQALSQRSFTLHLNGRSADFGWGAFVYGLLDFLFVVAAIYALVKLLKLDKIDKKAEDKS